MYTDLKAIQHYCAYKERCHSEVRYKLIELGFRGAMLEEAISELISEGFLNEERFARSYSRGKFRLKQWGKKKIIIELKRKQVSDFCIRKGLQEIDEDEYFDTLCRLAAKKYEELKKERNPGIRKQKVHRYLLQRGYENDLILEALKTISAP